MSGASCPQCGAPLLSLSRACSRCGLDLLHDTVRKPPGDSPAQPSTQVVQAPFPVTTEPDGVPTHMVPAVFPKAAPPAKSSPPPAEADGAPTGLVAAPFPAGRPAPQRAQPALRSPQAERTLDAAAETGDSDTGKNAAPFPVPEPADTGVAAAPFPVSSGKKPAPSPSDTARTPALFPADPGGDPDTGRVVAPFRAVAPEADTGRVVAPFRAVEAAFPLEDPDDDGGSEPPSVVSVPMAVAKRKGTTQEFDENPLVASTRPAPFPLEGTPPEAPPPADTAPRRALGGRERTVLLAGGVVVLALGLSTVWLVGGDPAPKGPRLVTAREAAAAEPVQAGAVRVSALCGGKQIAARLWVNGAEKGDTPLEVGLPTTFPPGRHELELHLVARFGEPVDARYTYYLPLDPARPGVALEVELEGCGK